MSELENGNLNTNGKLANNSVIGIVNVLKGSMALAKSLDKVQRDEIKKIKLPSSTEKPVTAFEKHEQEKIERYCLVSNKSNYIGIVICIYTGIRLGELLALTWEDIDFDKKLINIYKSVCREIKFDDEGIIVSKKITIVSPKTKNSNRVIPFCKELGKVLEDWKFECWLDSKITNKRFDDKSFLFKDKNSAICSYELVKQRFERFLAKNNLKQYNIHLHSLRHTFATMLFENNVNPKAIQLLMGHSNIKTTVHTKNRRTH